MDGIVSHVIWKKFACVFHADTVKISGVFFRQCSNRNCRTSRVERMKKNMHEMTWILLYYRVV